MILLGRPIDDCLPVLSWEKRFEHILVIGGSGLGKTTMMLNLLKHFDDGGVIVISPDGSLAERAYKPGCQYITKERPICLNPLKADYLSQSERANLLTDTLNFAANVATKDQQMGMLVLMQDIVQNCVRVGMKDLKEIALFLRYEESRINHEDEYWRKFDRREKGWLVDRESVESARRVAVRLLSIVNDDHAFKFFKGNTLFSVKRIADNKEYFVFNLFGMDDFTRSFIGSLIVLYVRSYYRHQGVEGGPPLYVLIDEGVHFIEDTFYKTFIEARKFHVSFTVSYHNWEQLLPKVKATISTSAQTHILLQPGYEALTVIGGKECPVYLNPPPETIHKPPVVNFLRDEWIAV